MLDTVSSLSFGIAALLVVRGRSRGYGHPNPATHDSLHPNQFLYGLICRMTPHQHGRRERQPCCTASVQCRSCRGPWTRFTTWMFDPQHQFHWHSLSGLGGGLHHQIMPLTCLYSSPSTPSSSHGGPPTSSSETSSNLTHKQQLNAPIARSRRAAKLVPPGEQPTVNMVKSLSFLRYAVE